MIGGASLWLLIAPRLERLLRLVGEVVERDLDLRQREAVAALKLHQQQRLAVRHERAPGKPSLRVLDGAARTRLHQLKSPAERLRARHAQLNSRHRQARRMRLLRHPPAVHHVRLRSLLSARLNEPSQVLVGVDLRVGLLLAQLPAVVAVQRDLQRLAVAPDHRPDLAVRQRDAVQPLLRSRVPEQIVLLEEPRKLLVRQVHPDHLRRCLGGREEYSPHPREALREGASGLLPPAPGPHGDLAILPQLCCQWSRDEEPPQGRGHDRAL